MKTTKLPFLFALLLAVIICACSAKKDATQETGSGGQNEWKEMDEFHEVMAEAFHSYKDSANLEPAKLRAGELAGIAEKWASATLPEKVNNDEMKEKIVKLKTESAALVQIVSTSNDKAIGEQLTKVHDIFHAIQEGWYGSEHAHEVH